MALFKPFAPLRLRPNDPGPVVGSRSPVVPSPVQSLQKISSGPPPQPLKAVGRSALFDRGENQCVIWLITKPFLISVVVLALSIDVRSSPSGPTKRFGCSVSQEEGDADTSAAPVPGVRRFPTLRDRV